MNLELSSTVTQLGHANIFISAHVVVKFNAHPLVFRKKFFTGNPLNLDLYPVLYSESQCRISMHLPVLTVTDPSH